ncbi:MAG TPA: hypothetical protein VIR65_07305 [Rhizorhapis sp.]
MGMTKLRHKIMADFDTWDGSSRIEDQSLGREDLEHWMKGSYLSVTKFQYVDYWIRKYRNDPILASVLDSLIKYKEDGYRKIFSELYTWEEGKLFNEIKGHLNDISGSIFCSEVISAEGTKGSISPNSLFGEYRQIIIYFREVSHSSISASILYVDTPISQLRLNPSKRDWVACFGYLTVSSKSNEMYSTISGPMHVFRDRTKGYHMAGESISHFQLFLQDLEFQTHWYPQIASRRTTRGHPNEIDPKIPELTPSEEEKGLNKSGIRIFRKINFSHEELEKYLFSLKNKALIW